MTYLIRTEWIKFHTLRSNWAVLAAIAVLNAAFLALGFVFFDHGDAPDTSIDARIDAVVGNAETWALLLAVLGVMAINREYKTKTVIPSLAAAPIRHKVLAAKAIIVGTVAAVAALALTTVNMTVGMITLNQMGYPLTLNTDSYLAAVAGGVAFCILAALFGLAVGLLLTNSTLAITLVLLVPFVLETSLLALPGNWIEQALPFTAGSALFAPGGTEQLQPWQGGTVLALWTAALLTTAAISFERRDLGNTA